MTTLLELTQTYQDLLSKLEQQSGELCEQDESALTQAELSLVSKVDACHFVIEKLDADADFYKAQAKKYQDYARALKTAQDRIKSRVLYAVQNSPSKRLEGDSIAFGVKLNPPALEVLDETLVPDTFKVIEVTIDNARLKDALKQGEEIPGARLTRAESLTISRAKK